MSIAIGLSVVVSLLSSSAALAQHNRPIAVGSKAFPESRILGELLAVLVEEHTNLRVRRDFGLAGTLLCANALEQGTIDLYCEYTGTGLLNVLKEPLGEDRDSQAIFNRVRGEYERRYGITWLEPLGFNNSYALATHRGIKAATISDLTPQANRLRASFHHEFMERPDGYPGLAQHYGIRFGRVGTMEHGLAYAALSQRQTDVMDAYTTDGMLKKYDLQILEDDRQFFPPYDAAPVVRLDVLKRHPELREVLNLLAGRITQEKMIAMNYQEAVERKPVEWIARNFLREEGLIASDGPLVSSSRFSLGHLGYLVYEHLLMVFISVLCASLFGIGLGLLVARHPRYLAGPVLGAAGVLQTVPSLAMLAFMLVMLGAIGKPPAIMALFLYALLPIVRNAYTGISSVPAELKEAAVAMGMTRRQITWQLEVPLATRTIMAGVRTALVITIGTATLGGFISAGGLGDPIIKGLQTNDKMLILWGAVPAALLAIACDFAMARLENWLEPRGLRLMRE